MRSTQKRERKRERHAGYAEKTAERRRYMWGTQKRDHQRERETCGRGAEERRKEVCATPSLGTSDVDESLSSSLFPTFSSR